MICGREAPGSWRRSLSAGDVLTVKRHTTPTAASRRRPFDSAVPPEELLNSPISANGDATPWSTSSRIGGDLDPGGRITVTHFKTRTMDLDAPISPSSPKTASTLPSSPKDRAMDHWRTGESLRIMHHLEPKKYRSVSLHGQVFQGKYRQDWHDISHIQSLRAKLPAISGSGGGDNCVPYPQGPSQSELLKNRCFARSHGSSRFPGGFLRVGQQVF